MVTGSLYIKGCSPCHSYTCYRDLAKPHLLDLAVLHTDGVCGVLSRRWQVEEEVWKQMLGIGSDGAAVMVGSRKSVALQILKCLPHVLDVYCMTHRLNMSFN